MCKTPQHTSGLSPLQPHDLSTVFDTPSSRVPAGGVCGSAGLESGGLDSLAQAASETTSKHSPPDLTPNKSARAIYTTAYKWAAQSVKDELMTCRRAAEAVSAKYGISIHFSTISKAASRTEIASPEKAGRKSYIPKWAEEKLRDFIKALRACKIPVLKQTVCTYANEMIEGTVYAEKFSHGIVDSNWYYGYLDRHGMRTGNQRPLELLRGKWCTAANMETHYKVVADALVEAKLAVWNPDYDDNKQHSRMIHITKPHI
ncbi:hypothetical protein CYMTET_26913 [Cymbomonas tetramitiformis]|uniref:Uncharacterized protein n=1 Tax=Cymbomonas tetramitiformis TaxID=36881 RepID=A0AAE0KXE7_9CHLO|nr:hypothetical protein CYMTET_26913 [Cymbomonas tetramitiformis]